MFFNIQKLLELKSNIKQTNTEPVFAKPFPPAPITPQQRGIKRPHDVGMSIKLNELVKSNPIIDFVYSNFK